jgi:hypothetical protein
MAKKTKEQRKRDKALREDRERRMKNFGKEIGYYVENPDYDPESNSGQEAVEYNRDKSALKKYGAESLDELFDRLERRAIQAGQDRQEQLGQVEGGQGTAARNTRQRFQLPVIGGGSAPQFFGDTAISRTGFRL